MTDFRPPHADITDCVTVLGEGVRERITACYRISETGRAADGFRIRTLVECSPDNPGLAVIETYAMCGRFHRPWTLRWDHPVNWSATLVADERRSFAARIAQPHGHLSSTDYPALLARFPALSAHEEMLLLSWRKETATRIAAWQADPEHP